MTSHHSFAAQNNLTWRVLIVTLCTDAVAGKRPSLYIGLRHHDTSTTTTIRTSRETDEPLTRTPPCRTVWSELPCFGTRCMLRYTDRTSILTGIAQSSVCTQMQLSGVSAVYIKYLATLTALM